MAIWLKGFPVNRAKLKSRKKLSPFFFEKKLYQFASKTLGEQDRDLMREYSEKNSKAKKSLASMLMSLEYLNQLKETKINKEWVEQQVQKEQSKENITRYTIISLLVLSLLVMSFLAYRVI